MTETAPAPSAPLQSTDFPHVDESLPPQEDFQRHVNGRWLKTAQIPSDLDAYGAFLELREKSVADVRAILEDAAAGRIDGEHAAIAERVGAFYTAFMDAERAERHGLEPLRPFLAEVDALTRVEELVELSARWQRYGMDGLVAAGALQDAGDPERMLWHIIQDGIGLPDESYYREDTHAETLAAYEQHLVRFLVLGGAVQPGEEAERAAADVVALETRIASHHWDVVTTRDAQKRYNLKSRGEAVDLMPLLPHAFAGWGLADRHTAEVVLTQPDVLPGVQAALTELPLETWKHWLRLQAIRWAAPLLHDELVQEHFDFYARTLNGTPELKERWKRGVALTNAHLGEDVAQIYIARHYPPDARAAMEELIAALMEAYRRSISSLEWMGEQTRAKALEKLGTFRPMVGFPARWIDYSTVEVDPADVVGNVARAAEFEWDRDVAKIDDGPDPEEWHMTPQTVNAYYHPLENVICFPAAILQDPFFSKDRDMAQNFGAIGAVIGHEIGHGFDDQGSRYGADGSLTNWWTEADREAFESRTARLVDQYGELSPSAAPEHSVNGELTLGENIGDVGGLGIAHKAYKLWLAAREAGVPIEQVGIVEADMVGATSDGDAGREPGVAAEAATGAVVDPDRTEGLTGDQRFFMAWAQAWRQIVRPERAITLLSIDPHSPPEIRANQVVRNLDAFHEAFGTSEGDGMYLSPAERVTIW